MIDSVLKTWFPILIFVVWFVSCSHLNNAGQYYDQGDYREVIRLCRDATRADSTDTAAYYLMGQSFEKLDSLKSAQAAFAECVRQKPQRSKYRMAAGRLYEKRAKIAQQDSNFYDALDFINNAISVYPDSARQISAKADILYQMGKHDRAREHYNLLLHLTHDTTNVLERLNAIKERRKRAEAMLKKGNQAQEKRRFETAIDFYEKALTLKPDFKKAQYELNITKGRLYYRKGSREDLWDSIMQFGYASNLYPERAEPHYYMGFAYHKKDRKEFDNAIQAFEKAARLEPESKVGNKAANEAEALRAHRKKMEEFWNH